MRMVIMDITTTNTKAINSLLFKLRVIGHFLLKVKIVFQRDSQNRLSQYRKYLSK